MNCIEIAVKKMITCIARTLMKMMLMKAKNDRFDANDLIVKKSYDNMIKHYEETIIYLDANN